MKNCYNKILKKFVLIIKICLIFILINHKLESAVIDAINKVHKGYINSSNLPNVNADYFYGEIVVSSQPSTETNEIIEPIYGKRVKYKLATNSENPQANNTLNCIVENMPNIPYCVDKFDNTSMAIPFTIANVGETIVNFTLPGKTDSSFIDFYVYIYMKPVDSTIIDDSLTLKCGDNFIISNIFNAQSNDYVEYINDFIKLTFKDSDIFVGGNSYNIDVRYFILLYLSYTVEKFEYKL